MASRKIEDLTEEMQQKYRAFEAAMAEAGLSFAVTCTARSAREQTALYAQGRNELYFVNGLRKACNLDPITEEQNERKITWIIDSKHITRPYTEGQDKARAFDIVMVSRYGRRAIWDIKEDVNENEIPDYEEAGLIGEKIGLKWGGRFKDFVHFEEA